MTKKYENIVSENIPGQSFEKSLKKTGKNYRLWKFGGDNKGFFTEYLSLGCFLHAQNISGVLQEEDYLLGLRNLIN